MKIKKEKNKYGLPRAIPAPIRRTVRQKCGFGCVICGLAICQYEHVDPPFSEAKEHNSDNIVLLCGSCHDKVTRGIWSKEKVKKAANNPKCKEMGFANDAFDIGDSIPEVIIGGSIWRNTPTIIEAMGDPILKIEPPEKGDVLPYRLSGIFCDDEGKKIFRIERNEWQGPISNWDIETSGPTLTIRQKERKIVLELKVEPQKRIIVNKIDMVYKGYTISGEYEKYFIVSAPDGSTISGKEVIGESCECGVIITENSVAFGYKCALISKKKKKMGGY